MARPLNKKVIKERIKNNKQIMKDEGKSIVTTLNAAAKGEAINAVDTRASLAIFIKASKAFYADQVKLESITE